MTALGNYFRFLPGHKGVEDGTVYASSITVGECSAEPLHSVVFPKYFLEGVPIRAFHYGHIF